MKQSKNQLQLVIKGILKFSTNPVKCKSFCIPLVYSWKQEYSEQVVQHKLQILKKIWDLVYFFGMLKFTSMSKHTQILTFLSKQCVYFFHQSKCQKQEYLQVKNKINENLIKKLYSIKFWLLCSHTI